MTDADIIAAMFGSEEYAAFKRRRKLSTLRNEFVDAFAWHWRDGDECAEAVLNEAAQALTDELSANPTGEAF